MFDLKDSTVDLFVFLLDAHLFYLNQLGWTRQQLARQIKRYRKRYLPSDATQGVLYEMHECMYVDGYFDAAV